MLSLMIEGCTRVCGKAQGYLGLPVRDIVYGDGTPAMQMAFEPTPKEIKALQAGAPLLLTILGTSPPPMRLEVECSAPPTSDRGDAS